MVHLPMKIVVAAAFAKTEVTARLRSIVEALNDVAREMRVVLPLHPRSRKVLAEEGWQTSFDPIDPVSYFDMLQLLRRARIVREEIGDRKLMMAAKPVWDVGEAIANTKRLGKFDPYWMEEPTSPDDVLGHAAIAKAIAPIRVATGEHCQNRVIFKQLLQAKAIGFCQVDACRLGGVNEVLAVLLMAAKFGVPVCPHAGGVGLCEYVQHISLFDYVAVSGSLEDRVLEYVDHLHEHFVDPVTIKGGRYMPPSKPGYSIEMKPESLREYEFPKGAAWAS